MVPLAYMPTAFVPGGICRDDRSTRGKSTSPRACLEPQAPALLELCSSCLGQALHPSCLQATTIRRVVDNIYHVLGTWLDD